MYTLRIECSDFFQSSARRSNSEFFPSLIRFIFLTVSWNLVVPRIPDFLRCLISSPPENSCQFPLHKSFILSDISFLLIVRMESSPNFSTFGLLYIPSALSDYFLFSLNNAKFGVERKKNWGCSLNREKGFPCITGIKRRGFPFSCSSTVY